MVHRRKSCPFNIESYQAVESSRWMYYRSDLAFSGHLVVLSVFDPSIGMVQEILKYQFAKHPLKKPLGRKLRTGDDKPIFEGFN